MPIERAPAAPAGDAKKAVAPAGGAKKPVARPAPPAPVFETRVLHEDDDVRFELSTDRRGPARTLVVTFDPIEVLADQPAYATAFLHAQGADTLAVRKKREHFYQPLSRDEFARVCGAVMRSYSRCLAYGSSLGAYAALYYCGSGCELVIASSPRVSVHPRFGTPRWRLRQAFLHESFDAERPADSAAVVFYDPHEPMDRGLVEQAILPGWSHARLVRVPYAGHPANHFLADIGFITPFVRAAVAGKPPAVAPDRSRKAISPAYRAALAVHCLQRRKPRWARDLAAWALAQRPRDVNIARTLGLAELACGDTAAALPLLRRVHERFPEDGEIAAALRRSEPSAAAGAPASAWGGLAAAAGRLRTAAGRLRQVVRVWRAGGGRDNPPR